MKGSFNLSTPKQVTPHRLSVIAVESGDIQVVVGRQNVGFYEKQLWLAQKKILLKTMSS